MHGGDLLLFVVLGVLISYVSEKRLRLVRQLREADRGKDEFLATLAHELRNPLAPIANSVEYLRLNPSSDPQRRKLSDVIKRQVDHMTRLVEDLLDISRITSDKLELRKESVILSQIIESAVETARPQIDAQAHELSVWLPAEPIYLNADLVRLSQVFSNLLNNAAKFTPRGGCVELAAAREGSEVEITVRDNGIGIEAGDLGRIFESFAQVGHVPRGTRKGIGIGLAIARRLVAMHGGTITAGSAGPGLGSEFTVRLPVSATPQYSAVEVLERKGRGSRHALPHPHRRRQQGFGGKPERAAGRIRLPGRHGIQRRRGTRECPQPAARRRPAGHRYAAARRIRSRPPDPQNKTAAWC